MFGKKTKELQARLAERETENEQLKQRISELETELDRLREQEALVLRAITEANRTAERIEAEAGEERDKMIADAEQQVKNAEEEAESVRKDADDYSENIRTDANIYVERTIIASQLEVKKRKDVMAEMNELLKKTTDYLNEQTETFTAMLKTVIEESEEKTHDICYEIEKCSCSCDECENPCMEHAGKPEGGDKGDEDEGEGEETSDCAEPCEPEVSEEAPAEAESEAACADGENAPSGVDPDTLPDEYESPAQLMKNIYYIQQRDLPVTEETADENAPVELPHDEKLDEIVSDVVEAS